MRSDTCPTSVLDRPQQRAIVALLGLVLEHVVQPVEQHFAALQVVPEHEQVANRHRRERDERVEGDEAANRQLAVEHLVGAGPQEQADAEERDRLDARPRRSSP